ncbi:MAG: hypothetical protein J7501_01715 [Bdellovibrio sp.]|nr:hypothetical protein [Bdellovibrio sp.]
MENENKMMKGFPAKIISKFIAIAAVMLSLAACNDSGGGSGTTVNNGLIVSGCGNCSTITNPMTVSVVNFANAANTVQFLNMALIIDGNRFYPGISSPLNNYQGPIALQGTMRVLSPYYDLNGYCVIPAGDYTVQTTSVSNSAVGMIDYMELYSSKGNIRMYMRQAMVYKDLNNPQAYRIFGGVGIGTVNGYTCSSSFGVNAYYPY